jgi:hypothetical protein
VARSGDHAITGGVLSILTVLAGRREREDCRGVDAASRVVSGGQCFGPVWIQGSVELLASGELLNYLFCATISARLIPVRARFVR